MSAGLLLLCCTAMMSLPHLSLLCDHYSDGIIATSHLPVARVGYDPLVQRYIIVVSFGGKNYYMSVLLICKFDITVLIIIVISLDIAYHLLYIMHLKLDVVISEP
jgi:hypothetical protein